MGLTITRKAESIQKKAKKPKTLAYYCKELSVNKHERMLILQHLNSVVFLLFQRTKNAPHFVCCSRSKCKCAYAKLRN